MFRRPMREVPRVTRAAQPPSSALPPTCIKTSTRLIAICVFRIKSGLFQVIIAVILAACLTVARMKKGENCKSVLPL